MKKSFYLLIVFFISVIPYAHSSIGWGEFTVNSISSKSLVGIASFTNYMFIKLGGLILNSGLSYLLMTTIVVLILFVLIMSVRVLESLKELQNAQERLLRK